MTTATAPAGLQSSNPALTNERVYAELYPSSAAPRAVTRTGVGIKTLVFLAFVIAGGAWGWAASTQPVGQDLGSGYANTTVTIPGGFWLASFGALFLSFAIIAAPRRAAVLGIVYSVLQGYCLGAISASFDAQTDGIVSAAVLATVGVFLAAWFLYATGLVQPTQRMAFIVVAALGGLCLVYLFVWVLAIFDWDWLYSDEFRSVGIVVLLITVGIAALSLVLDFGAVDAARGAGAPKELEWYLAFGLMVTLIWLYITILRLLALLSRN
jgi:uncharacterized YccA/Bax inhibitor family protein